MHCRMSSSTPKKGLMEKQSSEERQRKGMKMLSTREMLLVTDPEIQGVERKRFGRQVTVACGVRTGVCRRMERPSGGRWMARRPQALSGDLCKQEEKAR